MSRNMSGISSVAHEFTTITVTPTLSTDAYADGDVLIATAALANVVPYGGKCELYSLRIVDNDDKASDFDILILNANTSIGTANAAYNGADTVTDDILTIIPVAAADYRDMINAQVAILSATQADYGFGVIMEPASAGSGLWYAAISRDTDTFTASGLEFTFTFKRH